MSLDKAIKSGKEHRKPKIHGSGVCDVETCKWCMGNLTYKNKKRILKTKEELKEIKKEVEK